jgi:hypothetical protein
MLFPLFFEEVELYLGAEVLATEVLRLQVEGFAFA